MSRVIRFIFCLTATYQYGLAQVVVTPILYNTAGSDYTQNFDSLPKSGSFTLSGKGPINLNGSPINGIPLAGWQLFMTGGSNSSATFGISTGSSTGNAVYSFGSSGTTDRALGSLSSGTGIYAIGVILTNNTGAILNNFTVNFIAEQWRKGGSTNKNTWAFKYKTGVITSIDQPGLLDEPNLNFSSVINTSSSASLNGNLPNNQQIVSYTISGFNWKNGEQLLLRWDDADETGNDDGVGIDNFSFSAQLVSAVPSVQSLAATIVTSNSVVLNGSVNDNYANTSAFFEYDTLNIFSNSKNSIAIPDSISAGTGITNVSAAITGLEPGTNYYFRIKASNANGNTTGSIVNFTTAVNLPTITTAGAASVTTNTANLGGNITNTGGATITERGIVWSVNSNPTLSANKYVMGNGSGSFIQSVTDLPQGATLNVRAFATNIAGTAYGNNQSFTTQTSVLSLTTTSSSLTNTASANFTLKLIQNITGLTVANFALTTTGITGASITAISGSGNTYSITVSTGTGDGSIQLDLTNDTGIAPSINNKPFTSSHFYTIDKTPPLINAISIPNKPMKINDTIPVTILVKPDTDIYKISSGNINGFDLSGFIKKNDSIYTASFTVISGGKDIAALGSIPVSIVLIDSIGNTSSLFQTPIIQSSDPIDANKPLITGFSIPANGLYKTGDTLNFIFRFNENVLVTTTGSMATFSVTVGTRSKAALYAGGTGYDSLLFSYIIQPGDTDKDGIKTGSSITLNNTEIKDLIGNIASLVFSNTSSTKNITIDGIAPTVSSVITPAAAIYRTGDTLNFIVNYPEKIIVSTAPGSPTLTISIGTKLKNAVYISGTGSTALLFRYTVEPDDADKDGIKLVSPFNSNTATIKDEAGNNATLTLSNIGALSKISINPVTTPTITTAGAASVTTNTANLGGNITNTGGATITERGIVWSVNSNPTLSANKYVMGNGSGSFIQSVTDLPQGATLNVRAFATNIAGTAYGNNQSFTTQTSVLSLTTTSSSLTNTASANFTLKLIQNITGLTVANFALTTTGITGASITAISGSGNTYSITVSTGTGDGSIQLDLTNDTGIAPSINNKPFTSSHFYTIDKTPPLINAISIPNKPMKINDTIPVTILVKPDTDIYKISSGNINGFDLSGFIKKNDSIYTASFTVISGGKDIAALGSIPVSIVLIDSIGNTSSLFQTPIIQSSDPIDANKPLITGFSIPANGLYKTGDTLNFIFRFNENVLVTTTGSMATFSVTVGTRSKAALYAGGTGYDSLLFSYIIQPGDTDKDGIKTGSSITLNNTEIKDLIGNIASLVFSNTSSTKNITIDGIAPTVSSVITPAAAIYRTGDTLNFIVNYPEKIIVSTAPGSPTLTISIGTKLKNAVYISGTGSTALLFRYTVEPDDADKDGIKLVSPFNSNTATIKDEAGNNATLTLSNIGALSKISINPVTAAVSNVIIPDNGIYKAGDTLAFIVNFTEKVFVSAANVTPSLKLTIGNTSRHAFYQNGSGTNSLLFSYVIQPGEEDSSGIKMNTGISLNNGLLKDLFGNNVPILLNNNPGTNGILVDAVLPSIKTVTVPDKNIYKESDTLRFIVNFTEKVRINTTTDTPFLKLITGNHVNKLFYIEGSGTTAFLFRYIVKKGDLDKNGIKLDSVLIASSTGITDTAGNKATLILKNIGPLSNVKIDAVAPSFTSEKSAVVIACQNSGAVNLTEPLTVKDEETGEQLTWQIISATKYGSISKTVFTAISNGRNSIPNDIQYNPTTDFTGMDTFIVQVSDGVNTSQKTVTLHIQPVVSNNKIGPSQMVCTNNIPVPIPGSLPTGGDGQYQLTWELSANVDSNSFNKAIGTNNLQHYSPTQLTTTTWFRRKVVSGVCSDISPTSQITVVRNGIWTGSTNADWHEANNWCNQTIPDYTTDVFISANTRYAPIIKNTARCNHLTLFDNTQITVNGTLQLSGNITHTSGTIDATNGSITFMGTAPQNIPGKIFKNYSLSKLIINNTAGVWLDDDLMITGTVTVNNGSLITNNHLTITHTANIGASANGTSIKGNVSMEHYIKGGKRVFWLLGHPFQNDLSLDMIKDSIDITGEGGSINGFTNTVTNQPSAFRYDPITGNDSLGIDAGWIPFINTNGQLENTWKEFTGIRLLVRGRPGQGLDGTMAGNGNNGTYLPKPVLLTLSGPIHTGDQEVSLIRGRYPGYYVVANPYPSTIDLSLITPGSGVGVNYWIWNPYQGKMGGYSSIPFKNSHILSSFGAFIVKVNANTNSKILFTENCKVNGIVSDSLPNIQEDNAYHVELRLERDGFFLDRIVLFEIDSAKSGFDKLDAEKFWNNDVNFYSISRDQKILSIDARPVNNESTILLGLQTNEPGIFSIRVAKASQAPSNSLMLHDKQLNKWMKLEEDSIYHFVTTNDTASIGNNRFEITTPKKPVENARAMSKLITKITPVPANDKIIVNYLSPERANTTIRIMNLAGITLKSLALGLQKEGKVAISVADMVRGIYLLELRCGNQISTQKIIKN